MNKSVQWVSLVVVTFLLAGILAILIDISRNGIRIEHTGKVELVGMYDKIELSMPEPVHLVAGSEDGGIPVSLSGDRSLLVPLSWNPWTGKIEWGKPNGEDR